MNDTFLRGEFEALPTRSISEETCRKAGYRVGNMTSRAGKIEPGSKVHIAPVYDRETGELTAQKLRDGKKNFAVLGTLDDNLFGRNLWGSGGKRVVVTEGEIDMLSYMEVARNWPVVSLTNGSSGAKRQLSANMDWLCSFEQVVLAFDNDEPGQKAAREAAMLFPPGKCKIASLDANFKDFNDALKAGDGKAISTAVWNAKVLRPDGLVRVADIAEETRREVVLGLPWVFETLTLATLGRRYGEVYTLGAGTGIGKTDVLTQQIAFDVTTLKEKVGLFFLEQKPSETLKRIAGKITGRVFHIPGAEWTQEELDEAVGELERTDRLFFYDNFGACDWDVIEGTISHLHAYDGVRIFYLDHLTALADTSNERESLEEIMKRAAMLANRLQIILVIVSHLSTPDGTPHEEGGRVQIRHFKGSRTIGFWSHFMFGLERNQQDPDEEARGTTTFRVLKDRFTGRATGMTFPLCYDRDTGRLYEPDSETEQDDF